MLIFKYKRWLFFCLVVAFAHVAQAQQDHFVYLQTDNGKPFYIKMNNKILSSSSEGYIIIPNITTGDYHLKVGFPKKEYPEESFSISVGNQNEGYLIKHFEDKGLELFNLETLALLPGSTDSSTMAVAATSKDNSNPFTTMLANVVKDSTILQNHQVAVDNPIKKTDAAAPIPYGASDSASSAIVTSSEKPSSDSTAITSATQTPAGSPLPDSNSAPISKLASKQNTDGLQLVYADQTGNQKDTVNVFMPTAKDTASAAASSKSDSSQQFTITPTVINPGAQKQGFVFRKDTVVAATDSAGLGKTAPEQVFFIGTDAAKKKSEVSNSSSTSSNGKRGLFSGLTRSTKDETGKPSEVASDKDKEPANTIEVLPSEASSSGQNSDCKAFADNEDFLRLRKKMASEDTKEEMIRVAGKYFRSRCFSTAQVRDLSYLFLTDEGKYMFFDSAFAHVSDQDQYATLESQLKDPYYRKRFEALIGK